MLLSWRKHSASVLPCATSLSVLHKMLRERTLSLSWPTSDCSAATSATTKSHAVERLMLALKGAHP